MLLMLLSLLLLSRLLLLADQLCRLPSEKKTFPGNFFWILAEEIRLRRRCCDATDVKSMREAQVQLFVSLIS